MRKPSRREKRLVHLASKIHKMDRGSSLSMHQSNSWRKHHLTRLRRETNHQNVLSRMKNSKKSLRWRKKRRIRSRSTSQRSTKLWKKRLTARRSWKTIWKSLKPSWSLVVMLLPRKRRNKHRSNAHSRRNLRLRKLVKSNSSRKNNRKKRKSYSSSRLMQTLTMKLKPKEISSQSCKIGTNTTIER